MYFSCNKVPLATQVVVIVYLYLERNNTFTSLGKRFFHLEILICPKLAMCSLLEKSFPLLPNRQVALALVPVAMDHCTSGPICSASSGAGVMTVGCPMGHEWTSHSAMLLCQAASQSEWVRRAYGRLRRQSNRRADNANTDFRI